MRVTLEINGEIHSLANKVKPEDVWRHKERFKQAVEDYAAAGHKVKKYEIYITIMSAASLKCERMTEGGVRGFIVNN